MECIYKTVVGSHLYGLQTKTSDMDYKGLFFPDRSRAFPNDSQTIGITPFTPHNIEEFKNGEGAEKEEGVYYSVRYFIELLFHKGNPNLIELPFCSDKHVVLKTDMAKRVLDFTIDNLITRKMIKGYLGYFSSQIRAFETGTGRHREKRLKERHAQITSDMYDGKNFSHAYRIGIQGIELFSTGRMCPTMSGHDLNVALTMKKEKYDEIPRLEAIKIITDVERRLIEACDNSKLKATPCLEATNKFLTDIYSEYYGL